MDNSITKGKTLKKTPSSDSATVSKPPKGKIRENIEALVIAIILALFIRAFVVQAFKIPSGSMENTLLIGDYILVNKFIYGVKLPYTGTNIIPIKDPKRGDIIVFKFPGDPSKDYIKRVVGVGGDRIAIRDKKVYVNDQLQENVFAKFTDERIFSDARMIPEKLLKRDNYGPIEVPKNKLFVMGDNRDSSNDSRFWGFVDKSAVKGRAFIIYWSWNKDKKIGVRWDRLGDLIH
ncbi:MAG: signal peptidase I [Desulfobacteraceae bacterium]|jgi:signal peptidase I